jgi:hypothetical protein
MSLTLDSFGMSLFTRKPPPSPMIQTVVKAPSSYITPAHNSGGFSVPPIIQPTAPKMSPQTAHTAQQQARRMPAPPAPPFFQQPELLPHFEKLQPAEKGRDGKFTRTKRSGGEPFERICVLMPPELVEAVRWHYQARIRSGFSGLPPLRFPAPLARRQAAPLQDHRRTAIADWFCCD